MESASRNYGIQKFNFVDEKFLNSEHQVIGFLDELERSDVRFEWRFQGRVDRIRMDLIERMQENGLFGVSLGIESDSDVILKEMKKCLNPEESINTIRALLANGLSVHASFIVGMPSESPETIEQTGRFISRVPGMCKNVGLLTLFPGSALYEEARRSGKIMDENLYLECLGPVYTIPYTNLTKYSD